VGVEASTACRRLVAISRSPWTPSSRINSAGTMAFPGNLSLHPVEAFCTQRSGDALHVRLRKEAWSLSFSEKLALKS
jgi:hypothetical protein